MDKLQKFADLFRRKMTGLESEFERDLKALKTEFNTERFALISRRHTIFSQCDLNFF